MTTQAKPQSPTPRSGNPSEIWRSLHKVPLLITFCFVTLLALVAAALFAPIVVPFDPNAQQLLARLKPPAFVAGGVPEHPLGTDQLGRDMLSRIIFAFRPSLGIAAIGTVIGLVLGTVIGLVSGLTEGWLDSAIMMLVDVQLAIPFILLALMAVTIFGTGLIVLMVVVGFAGWETYARLTRGQVLATKNLPYIEASQALGASRLYLAARHVLPNIASPLLVLATLNFSGIVLLESALSFLGLGVQPPTASLGSMVGAGRDYMASAWWVVAVPSFFLFLLTMTTSLIGDWLRDTLDSRITL